MDYQIGKPFDRLGRRYRTGDAPPPDLDKATVQHYLRHGMLVAVQSARARRTRAAAPRQPKQAEQYTATPLHGPHGSIAFTADGQPATPAAATPTPPAEAADSKTPGLEPGAGAPVPQQPVDPADPAESA